MVKKKKFNISNRVLYTLITIGFLAILGVGVYGLTAGVAPNPGHLITEVAPPAGCTSGQFLEFSGGTWTCANPSSGGGSSQWTTSGSNIYYSSGNVGVGTSSPAYPLDVNGNVNAQAYYVNGVPLSTTGNSGSSAMQPLATTDSNGNWVWTSVGTITHSVPSGNGLSQVYTDIIQNTELDPNRPILGIKITGSTDDMGMCAVGLNGYFLGGEIRGGKFEGIDVNNGNLNAQWGPIGSYTTGAGDLNEQDWIFSQVQSGRDLGGQSESYACGYAGTCPNKNIGWNKAEGLSYIPEGNSLTVTSQFNNLGGQGSITCNIYVLYGAYSINPPGQSTQCVNAGGRWINNVCQFDGNVCPANWVSAGWTTTTSNTCNTPMCSGGRSICTTGGHLWSQSSSETCQYTVESFGGGSPPTCNDIPTTCSSTTTEIGCISV